MPTAINTVHIGPDETAVIVSQAGHAYISQSYDQIVPCVRRAITAGSGGTQLDNVPVGSVILRNGSGNSLMFIGGIGDNAVFSGRGISLYANETITLPVKNMNLISVMAAVSGEMLECTGFLSGPTVTMDVSGIFVPPDETPPSLFDVSPTSGISGVATNTDIWAQFDECISPDSVTTSVFTVRISGIAGNISGITFIDSQDCAKAWFQPYSGLISGGTMYVARIAGGSSGIKDMVGNSLAVSGRWHWTTEAGAAPPDTTPPNVSGTNPSSGTSNVGVSINPSILFSEQVQSGTVNSTNIFLRLSGTSIAGNVTLGSDLKTATIVPSTTLNIVTTYQMVVNSGVRDLAGNFLSPNVSIPFFTQLTGPSITYTVSQDGLYATLDEDKFRVGMKITAAQYIGQVPKAFRVYLAKRDNPVSGIVSGLTFQIQKSTGTPKTVTFSPPFMTFVNPQTLTANTPTAVDFYNPDNNYALALNDILEVQWTSGKPSTGTVRVARILSNSDPYVRLTERVGVTYSGSAYVDQSLQDLAGIMWTTGGEEEEGVREHD